MANTGAMRGLNRTPLEQALVNRENAVRASHLVEAKDNGYVPSPIDIVRAEIANARRYIELEQANHGVLNGSKVA